MSVSKKAAKNIKLKQPTIPTPGDALSEENKKWLGEYPTRMEVANYVNALFERHYMPVITNYIQMSSMVLQAILIDKGICTGDEIKIITEKFVSEQQRRAAIDAMENGLVSKLSKVINYLESGMWTVQSNSEGDSEKSGLLEVLKRAHDTLVNININDNHPVTDEDMKTCAGDLENLKSLVEGDSVTLEGDKAKPRLINLLSALVTRFQSGVNGDEKS